MPGAHKNIPVGAESAHPLGYTQSADPGVVGANRPWMDTTDAGDGFFVPKIRNSTDDGWLAPPYSTQAALDAVEDASIDADAALDTRVDALEAAAVGTPVSTQTGTTYTYVLGDAGTLVRHNNAAAIAATVPPNSSVAFPVGTTITVAQAGTGAVTLTPGSGVTINVAATHTRVTNGQYAVAQIVQVAANTWLAYGNLVVAP